MCHKHFILGYFNVMIPCVTFACVIMNANGTSFPGALEGTMRVRCVEKHCAVSGSAYRVE